MSNRAEVEAGRLVYSCRCGWLDLGHIDARSFGRPNQGVQSIWQQISEERGEAGQNGPKSFPVTFRESQTLIIKGRRIYSNGVEHSYLVRRGLSSSDKESVALAIFLDVSYDFENLQASFPYNLLSNSGFSEEDLVSDLIGFYTVVRPHTRDYLSICGNVSRAASLKVWDAAGSRQNRTLTPIYHPCVECPKKEYRFPVEYTKIRPAVRGELFERLKG